MNLHLKLTDCEYYIINVYQKQSVHMLNPLFERQKDCFNSTTSYRHDCLLLFLRLSFLLSTVTSKLRIVKHIVTDLLQ